MPTIQRSCLLILLILGVTAIKTYSQSSQEIPAAIRVNSFPHVKPTVPFLPAQPYEDLYGDRSVYIENIGQYGDTFKAYPAMGKILYGFEGMDMPVLFTPKGVICLQRKKHAISEEEMEEMEREGRYDEEMEEGLHHTDRVITFEWIGANPNPVIIAGQLSSSYHTYGLLPGKAKGFRKIIYKELYPGIDVVYSFIHAGKPGFEYSIVAKPGADISRVKMRVGGDIGELKTDASGALIVSSDINGFIQTAPITYYANDKTGAELNKAGQSLEKINSKFTIHDREIQFELPQGYDSNRSIIIDPFVTATSNLTGGNAGIAKDIDFDYEGNIYVTGGGNSQLHQLAKFNSSGVLLWTFNGTLGLPFWEFGVNYGGWVVEKTTGKLYLGQGGRGTFQVIRLTTGGVYDNYISDMNPVFQENWKMIWNCDGGSPKILIAGGGSVGQNINFGICTPPATALTPLNITGQNTGHQDLSDFVLDPKTNELYCIFSQGFITPITENNRMYKHRPPYTSGNTVWTRLSGYTVLNERANRPYLLDGIGFNDNSINTLAVNSHYLFYYDGFNLAAMDKSNGTNAGAAATLPLNVKLMQGGVIADECNNVYVGSTNGTIKVYKFNGSSFNDAGAPDISIAGFSTASVYDLAYDNAKNLIYACGKGFVAAIDISSYCAAAIYTVTVQPDCIGFSAKATLSPALPAGSTVTYELYNGTTLLTSNNSGSFILLSTGINYTVKALVNQACGGTQAIKNFNLTNCGNGSPGSGIYVPTGFTPNGDGLNDILKAIPYGVKEFKHFSLYNRWGELVFRTADPSVGWDGRLKGRKQDSGVYIWRAEAIGIDDKLIQVKGTTVLIR
jgi:gliding motility-associated-like protein